MSDSDVARLAAVIADRVTLQLAPLVAGVRPPAAAPGAQATGLVTKSELALALRKSASTIDRWALQGMPFVDHGSYRLYDVAACRAWVRQRPRRPTSAGPATPDAGSPDAGSLPAGVERRTRKRAA